MLLIVPGILVLALIQVSIAKLALSVVYFVIGYTLFASLMAGTGMLGRTAGERAAVRHLDADRRQPDVFSGGDFRVAQRDARARCRCFR